jgi:DNA-binding GntR family transcriptional regulator
MYDCIKARALRSRCYVQYLVGPKDSSKELTQRLRCHDSFIFALKNGLAEAAREEIRLDINGMIEMYVLR